MKLGVRKGWAGAAVLIALVALTVVPSASPEQSASKLRRVAAGFLDVGGNHSCVVLATRAVRCWGDGANGQLGYGNLNSIGDSETPGSVGPVDLGAVLASSMKMAYNEIRHRARTVAVFACAAMASLTNARSVTNNDIVNPIPARQATP